ncbi:MAG TPA: DUF4255 domain-containing protein [Gemmataceae bacterium]|nr:DUF4255 domain-containing protein [Gemmataceae bacterium]
MANYQAILSVGNSLVKRLKDAYIREVAEAERKFDIALLSSGEMNTANPQDSVLSLYLYRVTQNEYLRNARQAGGAAGSDAPLSLDLHYLLTVWANSPEDEHKMLGWAMRQLHRYPVLDSSTLTQDAEWGPGDVVQVIPAELSNEDVMRIWDALDPAYRLSVSYTARVVRIDAHAGESPRPVVAKRLTVTDRDPEPNE